MRTAPVTDGLYEYVCLCEVRWYREHGRYTQERITRDRGGVEYVIGDWSWNRQGRPAEWIEHALRLRSQYESKELTNE
jgi:hypothetical protein